MRTLRLAILLAHTLACTSGSAQTDANIAPDGNAGSDASIGCTSAADCTSGLDCCELDDDKFCISLEQDRNNCGACGNRCDLTVSDRCGDGDCRCGQDASCPEGIECCGDAGCATRDDSCGTCGSACPEDMTCDGGTCLCLGQACGDNDSCCGDGCTNLGDDPLNCGSCGNICQDGQSCQGGECVCDATGFACPAGYTCCDHACRDLANDYESCGSCLFQCDDGAACTAGSCEGTQTTSPLVPPTRVARISTGYRHVCVVFDDGGVRCWGEGIGGQLGYGHELTIGDDEVPADVGRVRTAGPVADISGGGTHSCALTSEGTIRCWGSGVAGQLGYGNADNIGDDESPAAVSTVDVGGVVTQVSTGMGYTCAVLASGALRCWGQGSFGELGYGNTDTIGDDESPAQAGDVPLGAPALQVAAGLAHTCAIVSFGSVRCWGHGGDGRLGYGNTDSIGDDEPPSAAGNVPLGAPATQVVVGINHSCALLNTGSVRCWGTGSYGKLGYGNLEQIGDDETPASVGDIDLGGTAVQLAAGSYHSCALLADGNIRCWGRANRGQTGYGVTSSIGDNETPASMGNVPLGSAAIAIAAANETTCALLVSGEVKCWGENAEGQLGLGTTDNIGDDETPADQAAIRVF